MPCSADTSAMCSSHRADSLQHCAVPEHKLQCSAHTHLLSPQKRPARRCRCRMGCLHGTQQLHSEHCSALCLQTPNRVPSQCNLRHISRHHTATPPKLHVRQLRPRSCSARACPAADLLGASQGSVMRCPAAQGKGNSPKHALRRGLVRLCQHARRPAVKGFLQHDRAGPVGSSPCSCLHVTVRPETSDKLRACMWKGGPAVSLHEHQSP